MIEMIKGMEKGEYERMKIEEEKREKIEKKSIKEMKEMPKKYREKERYINMKEEGWEVRYNRVYFGEENIEKVVERYKEGIEWVYEYYTQGCRDNKWSYGYSKAPLLKDIAKSGYKKDNPKLKSRPGLTEKESIDYIMPKEGVKMTFDWSYKQYLWESDVIISE
jgi:5'-3' exonuclease